MNALQLDTVLLSKDRTCLEILDQTLLPGTIKVLHVSKIEDIWAYPFFSGLVNNVLDFVVMGALLTLQKNAGIGFVLQDA